MTRVLACERLGLHGELRAFLRDGPPEHLAFELFQAADGRAWTLRVPLADRVLLARVVRMAAARLARPEPIQLEADGTATLARETLASGDQIVAVVLTQEASYVFALWRREPTREGWTWTLDAVFVPMDHAGHACAVIEAALAQ